MNMADRIQYLRKAKGFSQEEFANKVGVSRHRRELKKKMPKI